MRQWRRPVYHSEWCCQGTLRSHLDSTIHCGTGNARQLKSKKKAFASFRHKPILRTSPSLGVHGNGYLTTLIGQKLYPKGEVPCQQTAWYRKQQATFADVFYVVRR